MSLADVSIKRPTFITCIIIVMIAVGLYSASKLGVDLFPNVTFPVVTVTTPYPGAGPTEIESLVSKPLEDEIATLSGIKRLSSINEEGVSVVIAEFTLETDIKFAEQQIRDRVGSTKRKLPKDILEPTIRRIDPGDQAVLTLALDAPTLGPADIYDLASEVIKPKIEQVAQVGVVDIIGGRKREIHVLLDRNKLKAREISANSVAQRLAVSGENVPAGKVDIGKTELVFRSLGQFKSLKDIENAIVNFFGSDVPISVKDVGSVTDTLVDEKNRAFINGKPGVFLNVFRQSGSNTIAVVDGVKKRIDKLNAELSKQPGKPQITVVRDASIWIRANVTDVKESITFGIILAVIVVYFFLANGRSTIITGLALPNSLIGAFILMSFAGFTINIMTLLALSLSVGLLVDDAIVVRENIFRHLEMGKSPGQAAREGTAEVRLAVIATTAAVLAVFGPVGFLQGVVGQFFKEFGLTICFAMAISLFDALTIAPMLSAYFAGRAHGERKRGIWGNTVGRLVDGFNRFQTRLDGWYENLLKSVVKRPLLTLTISLSLAAGSCATVVKVPKTFLPPQDAGEFSVAMDLPPGTSLDETNVTALKMDKIIRDNPEVAVSSLTVGSKDGASNQANFYVKLIPYSERPGITTSIFKEELRTQLKELSFANPKVGDYDAVGGGQRPFNMNIVGLDQKQIEKIGLELLEYLKKMPGLKDPDINFRPGKPEFQAAIDVKRADRLGVSSVLAGQELRTQIEGVTTAKFRQDGKEYDIRVRLKQDQRNLKDSFNETYIPNINNNLVRLSDVADPIEAVGPSKVTRQDRSRYIQIQADITPGAGIGDIMNDINKLLETDYKLPEGVRHAFVGQAENFQELGSSMITAMGFGVLFIFLVLSSLYESFVTPLTIMTALPLAMSGSFVALAITGQSLNIFSMIGVIMLLGVATKNSILLVDYAMQLIGQGKTRAEAMVIAGKTRLRPILMTTMALIAGTLPIALGLNEASRQRTSMGIAIIGGLVSSTILTLVVVPASFSFIDRFRVWSKKILGRMFGVSEVTKEDLG
ncbi:MAG: efflux RND transporter permease subunit [Xanthomonadaceae bacterium]|nr:efflux RND transporter permease subunit [Xanthomonadaceae bacterium]